jgi:hypothetical protein
MINGRALMIAAITMCSTVSVDGFAQPTGATTPAPRKRTVKSQDANRAARQASAVADAERRLADAQKQRIAAEEQFRIAERRRGAAQPIVQGDPGFSREPLGSGEYQAAAESLRRAHEIERSVRRELSAAYSRRAHVSVTRGQLVYLTFFNIDDEASVTINGKPLLDATGAPWVMRGNPDTLQIDITSFLLNSVNQLELQVNNHGSGYTWGFELASGNQVLHRSMAGTKGQFGAFNNDQTVGRVFTQIVQVEWRDAAPTFIPGAAAPMAPPLQPPPPTPGSVLAPGPAHTATSRTPAGRQAIGLPISGFVAEGRPLVSQVQMVPGKCYTVVASSLDSGVVELNVQLVAVTPVAGTAPVLAVDNSTGNSAVLGQAPNCYKWAWPMAAPVNVVVLSAQGGGEVSAQVFAR